MRDLGSGMKPMMMKVSRHPQPAHPAAFPSEARADDPLSESAEVLHEGSTTPREMTV